MQYNAPQCLTCKYFKGRPTVPYGKAKCAVKARGVAPSIYFEGKKCSSYSPKKV